MRAAAEDLRIRKVGSQRNKDRAINLLWFKNVARIV
jgi:hypothetical protein